MSASPDLSQDLQSLFSGYRLPKEQALCLPGHYETVEALRPAGKSRETEDAS